VVKAHSQATSLLNNAFLDLPHIMPGTKDGLTSMGRRTRAASVMSYLNGDLSTHSRAAQVFAFRVNVLGS
jgi:hypothetical protein